MATLDTQKWIDYYAADKEKKKETTAAGYDAQKTTVTDTYTAQIDEAEASYEDDYRENAVQKLINERQVAENMANLGLTDSGLNRTQQTAVQLSYANNKASIDKQKRAMIDGLTREMTAYLTEIDTEKASALRDIDDNYSQLAAQSAQDEYAAALEAETEQAKAYYDMQAEIAKQQIKSNASSSSSSSNTSVIYTYQGDAEKDGYKSFLGSDGKVRTFAEGINPYTGTDNKKEYAYEAKNYGFFSNGYQPKGIKGYGLLYKADKITINGKTQNVWYTDSRRGADYWVWDGTANQYVSVEKVNGQWTVK